LTFPAISEIWGQRTGTIENSPALLTMLKLIHLTSFWPREKKCVLKKLNKRTLDELSEITNRTETILLLDSLDEDPAEILDASQHFFRVIITCRTQFFPDVKDDPIGRLGMVSIGGFNCPVKYLSFFDEN